MLRELHISNLAIIADARIELANGLNCFTGATGAGKSLVIGAVEVLLGLRSPSEMLRPGAEEGRVSGVFDVKDQEVLSRIEAATDVPVKADGGEVLITRKLYASGRSSVSLNGKPITLSMLREASEQLVDVHGQHDHQYLLKPINQLDVIDQFGSLFGLREQYRAVFDKLQAVRARLHELSTNGTLRRQQLDLYLFQAEEIDAAELDGTEYARLQGRSAVLVNLEKLKTDAGLVHQTLYEADESIVEKLKSMVAIMAELAGLDPALQGVASQMKDGVITLEESAFDLNRYLDRLDLDPGELAEVNDRLDAINRVLHKYGDPIEAAIAYREKIGEQIAELQRSGEDLSELQKQIAPLTAELKSLGNRLSGKRKEVAAKLSPAIESQLSQLGMEKATFQVRVTPLPSTDADGGAGGPGGANGFDIVEFVAQTNPGQAVQPLRKIASGGELSRIMLALKGILAQGDRVDVLVFDEIDSNVGGRLGSVIGSKLRALAASHQVLCITHLPQIACYADRHFTVRKQIIDGNTQSTVRHMEGDERLQEVAEMIGGQKITETTRAQARELMETAAAEFAGKRTTRGRRDSIVRPADQKS